MKTVPEIEINLDNVRDGLRLFIISRGTDTLYDCTESASVNNEAKFQLKEGCFYDYKINSSDYVLGYIGENIIQPHSLDSNLGTIAPNIFTGTLYIPVINKKTNEECSKIELEVQSAKTDYREDYRDMLEYITEKCSDLILQIDSPSYQKFEVDNINNAKTLYQRFAFIKSIINSDEFTQSVHRVVTSPTTQWTELSDKKDIRQIKRFSNGNMKEIVSSNIRNLLPKGHYLKEMGFNSLPNRITAKYKTDTVDTPENRFVKFALESFLSFCVKVNDKAKKFNHQKTIRESETLIRELENHLHHSFFKKISRPNTLKLNSPVLQRKEGYREILRIWFMFSLAAKLIWKGSDYVYDGGKKDVATLYEYWLFFQLLELFQETFFIKSHEITDLLEETGDGFNLRLKQGTHTAIKGIYDTGNRKLNIRFSYNRPFSGKKTYPNCGSWTTTLRPDYTLSIWPVGILEEEAELQELIVHIHFDAKYKVDNLAFNIKQSSDEELDKEKEENRGGVYKNADLLKMHAYKDAIRRTGGAYVLYPGSKEIIHKGFHEIIPGLGAFPVRPSRSNSGIGYLKSFILEVIEHFLNRASQRERFAFRTYEVHKTPPESNNSVNELLPEPYNENRNLIPDDTFVLVGFYNTPEQYDWIKKNKLYNFRMNSRRGSIILDKETVSSKYLLLHTHGDKDSGDLWKIVSPGPRVYSKHKMEKLAYPKPKDKINDYLVIQIEKVTNIEFQNMRWNFRNLKNYKSHRVSAYPFTASLSELMRNRVIY
jgi:predicted component of viral defense system (DUF524 family)